MFKDFASRLPFKRRITKASEWRTDSSIFSFLKANVDPNGKLKDSAHDLPDQKADEHALKFAPGLTDALFGADDSDDAAHKVNELIEILKEIAATGDLAKDRQFYACITKDESVIGIMDAFLEGIAHEGLSIDPHLSKFAKALSTKSSHRNAVKFGLAILGLCQDRTVINDVKLLGLHDEFTVYATVAIANLSDSPATDLWELAKKVDGWGRIQLVDRLTGCELNDDIRNWLVYEGYKNSIMYEYLAFTCATHGLLHEKLERKRIDLPLFKASGDIITALIMGGPAEDISQYVHAPAVIPDYIGHAREHTSDLADFLVLHRIKEYLSELQQKDDTKNSWTEDLISNCLIELVVILNSRDWRQPTIDALRSDDNLTYWNGKLAAEKLGLDLWEAVWQRLMQDPLKSFPWYDVTHYAKPEHADQIIRFAMDKLPLSELATGPKDLMGLGPEYEIFRCLDSVITFLEDHAGKGTSLILTALRSPVTRNRNMALKTLSRWGQEHWPDGVRNELHRLKDSEPNEDTLANIERLIGGKELSWNVVA